MKIVILFLVFMIIGCTEVYTPKEHIKDVTDYFDVRCIRGKKYLHKSDPYGNGDVYVLYVDDDGKPIKCE
jgi:hypothetical protein